MKYDDLRSGILNCRLCHSKFGFEPHPIVMGNEVSKIVQISQAPSQNVHQTLKPFDDASGKKLRNEWYHVSDDVFYDYNNFYIASIAHCYPGKNKSGGDKLPPVFCAKTWLVRELPLINNRIYILLGSRAAHFFFPGEDFSSLVFEDRRINDKPAYILPHPSPLNVKWFKDHPRFLSERVFAIEEAVHSALAIL